MTFYWKCDQTLWSSQTDFC